MGRPKLVISPDDPLTLKAIEMYRNGASLKAAAEAVYMSDSSLLRRFRALGIPTRKRGRRKALSSETIEAIRREYVPHKNGSYVLAEKYGVSPDTIRNYVRKR